MKSKTLYLHIGAHKTASSLLQTLLRANDKALQKNGISLINDHDISSLDFYQKLMKINKGKIDNLDITEEEENSFSKVTKKCKGDILITSENLFASLALEDFYQHITLGLNYIKNLAKDYNINVIFYVRKQVDYTESVFMQFIHLSIDKNFNEFTGEDFPKHLSWFKVIENINNIVGIENLMVHPFESIKDIGQREFLNRFLLDLNITNYKQFSIPEGVEHQRGANRSYSELGMEIAKLVNPLLNKQDKNILRSFLQSNFSTATHKKAELFSVEQRKSMSEYYKNDNRKMFEKYMSNYDGKKLGYYDQSKAIKSKKLVNKSQILEANSTIQESDANIGTCLTIIKKRIKRFLKKVMSVNDGEKFKSKDFEIRINIKESSDSISFSIDPDYTNVQIAYYLYKNDEKVDTQWYSKNFVYTLDKNKFGKGRYRVRYFMVDNKIINPGSSEDKKVGFTEYIDI